MKRGQLPSQPLVYILGLIILSLILFYGYRSIRTVQEPAETIAVERFKAELARDISTISNEYGSVINEDYWLPDGFNEICLVDLVGIDKVNPNHLVVHPLVKDSVMSSVKDNVFIIGPQQFEGFYVEELNLPPPHFVCRKTDDRYIRLQFEGRGDSATVITPPNEGYCINAENGDLCDGLDITFGYGYMESCCDHFTLCC